MNTATFADHARQKKTACLLAQLDRMKNEVGATDEDMHEFASGLSNAEWAALTDAANEHCIHGVRHTSPSRDAVLHVIDALFARLPNRAEHRARQLALTAQLSGRRHLEVVR